MLSPEKKVQFYIKLVEGSGGGGKKINTKNPLAPASATAAKRDKKKP